MSTPTIELMYRHRSIRQFTPEPISRDTVETIVAAGQRAATSSNLQLSARRVAHPRRMELRQVLERQGFPLR